MPKIMGKIVAILNFNPKMNGNTNCLANMVPETHNRNEKCNRQLIQNLFSKNKFSPRRTISNLHMHAPWAR